MDPDIPPKKTKQNEPNRVPKVDKWQANAKVKTPRGEATRIGDVVAYIRKLNEGHSTDEVEALRREGHNLEEVMVYRLFVRGAYDKRKVDAAIKALTADGRPFCVCQIRVSGSENQQDGASLPQQERDNFLAALRAGAKKVFVVVEVFSATDRYERALFKRLVARIEKREVDSWVASSLDRITRNPLDAVLFTVAAKGAGMVLRSASHTGPVKPNDALILMIQFIVGAFHGNAISAGNARGWRARISRGEFPNPGQPLPGMLIGADNKPSWSPEARVPIRRLFELVDPSAAQPCMLSEALDVVNAEFPGWWYTSKDAPDAPPPSRGRIIRLLTSPALVDGEQEFERAGETCTGVYPTLSGIVDRELFDRVQTAVAPEAAKGGTRGLTPWERTFYELVVVLRHPIAALVAESEGAIVWNADGSFSVRCTKCAVPTEMDECDPHFDDLVLADGTERKQYRVAVFRCESCNSTTRPLSLRALRLLLAGVRLASCPWCGSYNLRHRETDPPMLALGERTIRAICLRCARGFAYDAAYALAFERYRYFAAGLGEPTTPKFRPETGLFAFDEDDGAEASE